MPRPLTPAPGLRTERLILRPWRPEDREPFARMNADPRVMEFFPSVQTREQSDSFADRIEAHFAEHGHGPWAVELPGQAPFIGFVGLLTPVFAAHFMPAVEVGWRLDAAHWRRGYATEAALASVRHGFGMVGLAEIVSFTAVANRPSRAVMERIGMSHDPADDFDHPALPGHPLQRHVLYRLRPDQVPAERRSGA